MSNYRRFLLVLLLLLPLTPADLTAAPLPARVREGVPGHFLCHPGGTWSFWVCAPEGDVRYVVCSDLVLVVEGRRANLGEMPGLLRHTLEPQCRVRAWSRGGRLELLEVSLAVNAFCPSRRTSGASRNYLISE